MENHLTPLEIMILIHYSAIYDDFKSIEAPAQRKAIEKFIRLELIKENMQIKENDPKYVGNTEALEPYIKKLCSIPLPKMEWVVPENFNSK